MKASENKLIVIGGPTASGKTQLAIELAERLQTEIINADSRQFYKEMSIGTAVPSPEELKRVPHHLIQSHTVQQPLSAADFEEAALPLLRKLFKQHEQVILCGGSGLYIKALAEGLDPLPPADEAYRKELELLLEKEGVEALANLLIEKDPQKAETTDLKNPRRLIRILEIIHTSGIPTQKVRKKPRGFQVQSYFLNPERSELYERINQRVDKMMQAGLLDEVKSLLPFRDLSPLQTLGYSELFDHLDGKYTLEEAVEKIKQHSRNYAKRQLTWFRNQGDYHEVKGLNDLLIDLGLKAD